jgi:hypothetical protein
LTNHPETREWTRLRPEKTDTGQQSQNGDRAHRLKLKGKRTEEQKRRCEKTATSKQQNYMAKFEQRNVNVGTIALLNVAC